MSEFGGPTASQLRRFTIYSADDTGGERAGVGVEFPHGTIAIDLDDVQTAPVTVDNETELRAMVRRYHHGRPDATVDVWVDYEDPQVVTTP